MITGTIHQEYVFVVSERFTGLYIFDVTDRRRDFTFIRRLDLYIQPY